MRIAMVTPASDQLGGVPGMARSVAAALARGGHHVECFSTWHGVGAIPDDGSGAVWHRVDTGFRWNWPWVGFGHPMATHLAHLYGATRLVGRLASTLVAAHRAEPFDVVYRFSTIELLGLGRFLDDLPPIVVHPEVHAAGEAKWLRRERHLSRRCEPRHRRWLAAALMAFRARRQRRDLARVDAVLCPSRRFAVEVGEDYGVDPRRVRVVPNPIDVGQFQPGPVDDGPRRVIYVGRTAVRKGIDQMVELSWRLSDLAGDVVIEVIGGPSPWSDYRGLLDSINPAVGVYLGALDHRAVAHRLRGATVAVQPSSYEPFAISVAEALASGVPVVATDAVGAAESIDPVCVSTVPVGRPDLLEAAVRDRLAEARTPSGRRARLSARRVAVERFDPDVVGRGIADVLAEVVGDRAQAPS